jgi:predicted O-methyltransferase YrrM
VQSPTWTILIPTLGQRADSFRALLGRLLPQTEPYGGRVRVLAAFNNGSPPLPELRQRLVEAAETDYLSFVDDDDMVSPDFVGSIMTALEQRPDYVGFQLNYFAEGKLRGVIDHSLKHGGWREEKNPYRWLRDITHINPIRAAVAKAASFRVAGAGQVEDRPWVAQVRESGLLKTENYIPRPLYDYLWSRRGSAWQRPERIRQGIARPEITHDNFRWLPVHEHTPGRLAVIVPTRGRPDNIRKVIAAWDETNAWECADLILATDADDPARDGYTRVLDEISSERVEKHVRVYQEPAWVPMVKKLNDAADTYASFHNDRYTAIAFAGDDHLPRTKHWAAMYLAALDQLGTGMVYGDDGYQGAKLSTEWAVTADAVRALGRMVPAPVDHLYCDNAMMDLFGGAGALRHLPEVRIEHMHPAAGKATSDAQYDKVNSREQYRGDRQKYDSWRNGVLSEQIGIIRRLRGDRPVERPRHRRGQREASSMRGSGPRRVERSGPRRTSAPPKSKFPFPPEFREIRGATPDEIAFTLADFARAVPADQEIVELGVFQARTAVIMAWGASLGNGAHVTAIDPWELAGNVYDPPFTEESTRRQAEHNVTSVGYGDRVRLAHQFSLITAWNWNTDYDGQVGLLFVDGDHTKEGARRDIEAWAPHLAPGAVIAVDDYGHPDWPGVAQAVDELVDEGFLAPVQIFHDRLAVTKLAIYPPAGWSAKAITSEGVEPEPDAPEMTLGDARKKARALGLKPVAGGIEAVLAQIAEHEGGRS